MSHLKMLLASAAAALVIAIVGPLILGATPAFADGPQMNSVAAQDRHVDVDHHRMDNDHQRQIDIDHQRQIDIDHERRIDIDHHRQIEVEHQRRMDNDHQFRFDNDQSRWQGAQQWQWQSVRPLVTSQSFYWMPWGLNWNAGWTFGQLQQFCLQYGQIVSFDGGAFNPYVQAICAAVV